jgi:hypothetical protein
LPIPVETNNKNPEMDIDGDRMTATNKNQTVEKTDQASRDISYNPRVMEKKWQAKWEADKLYRSVIDESRPKHYALTMLPYPSGDLHIGHWFSMIPPDARARFKRMQGYNVLFPMGFDAFGLPAEGAAIKHNIHPKKWTYENIDRMRTQMRSMGAMFDWEREAVSSDPEYYKWTEWFFIQLFKHGLAYRKKAMVDWCPKDNTTLAHEQVKGEERVCERCGTPVIKKELEQWFFKATKYADELLVFDEIEWPQTVRTLQTNWIGRSEGASVIFKTAPYGDDKSVTRSRSSPPAPTHCGVRPSWSCLPSIRWWTRSPRLSIKLLSMNINCRQRARRISSAKPPTRKRRVCSPAGTPSIPSTTSASRSGSRTMC